MNRSRQLEEAIRIRDLHMPIYRAPRVGARLLDRLALNGVDITDMLVTQFSYVTAATAIQDALAASVVDNVSE